MIPTPITLITFIFEVFNFEDDQCTDRRKEDEDCNDDVNRKKGEDDVEERKSGEE